MTSRKEVKHRLLAEVGDRLREHGFALRAGDQSFVRKRPSGRSAFHLAFIDHESDFDVTADVAVRFDDVEELVHGQNPLLSARARKETYTLGAELGNLADGRQRRWSVLGESDLPRIADDIYAWFLRFGLPYIERYSSRENALSALSDNGPTGWKHSPVHLLRCQRALALAGSLGHTEAARHLAEVSERFLESHHNRDDAAQFRSFAKRIVD